MSGFDREALRLLPAQLRVLDVAGFDEAGLGELLSDVRAVQRCLDGLVTRVGIQANRLAEKGCSAPAAETARGAGSVGSRQARREAGRAEAAEQMPGLVDAMSEGSVSGEHADSLARHSARMTDEQRAMVDFDDLLARAAGMPPETFDRLVKRTVDAVTDHGLADTISKQQASEFRHWYDERTGMGRFTGSLDPERYETLINAVEAHMTVLANASEGDLSKTPNLAVQALVDLVTNSQHSRGRIPAVTVVVDHDTLLNGPHPGSVRQTENGHDLPGETIARLCCDATLRRVVLDERGVPINVGRTYRTATDGQWAALKAMHSTCAWNRCHTPINWCQAHHIREWEHGGPTDLQNLVPLCNRHHHQVHEGQWHIKLTPDRTLKIFKPDSSAHTTVPTPQRC